MTSQLLRSRLDPRARVKLPLPIPQPHTRPVSVLIDKDHAGLFEGAFQHVQRCVLWRGLSAFKITDGRIADLRRLCQPLLRPI